jgi:hypothetical protein
MSLKFHPAPSRPAGLTAAPGGHATPGFPDGSNSHRDSYSWVEDSPGWISNFLPLEPVSSLKRLQIPVSG